MFIPTGAPPAQQHPDESLSCTRHRSRAQPILRFFRE